MIKHLTKLLKIAKEYKLWMLLASFVGFLTIGSSIGLMMTSAYIIAKAALHPSVAELQVGIVGVRLFGISRGIFRYLERYISHEVTFSLLAKFRVWFFTKIEPLVPSRISNFKSGDLLNRAVSDVENLEHFYVRVIAPPIIAFFVLILFVFLFGMYSFFYSMIIAFFFLLAGLGVPVLTYFLSKNIGPQMIALKRRLTELSVDQTQGLADLLVFGQKEKFNNDFNKVNTSYTLLQRKMALITAMNDSLIGLLMNFAVVVILFVAIPNVTSGFLDGVYLSVLTLGTMAVFEAVLPLPTTLQYLEKTVGSANLLFDIENKNLEIINDTNTVQKPKNYSIDFNSVNFSYSPQESIYNNISIQISENQLTAIVGASGAGKSTLINLLLKFWDYEGDISIGGINIKDIPQNELINLISVAQQTTHLFNLSIKENLRFAKEDATDPEIIDAAKKAHIHEFIQSLPNKYDELIGEQGLMLSGGERQRLSIAVAILKDSPIMIFDEPTSDLDSITEAKLLETFYQLSQYKTIILITHRLANLQKANKIVVLKKGAVIEQGKYEQLIQQNGYFFKMLTTERDKIA